MTRHCWFPDNTVLCNFASVDRLGLLEKVLDGRGRWTQAVAAEAEQSARFWPKLHQVPVDGWLGDPIEIDDPAETALVDRVRRVVFAGSPTRPLQHLGEARDPGRHRASQRFRRLGVDHGRRRSGSVRASQGHLREGQRRHDA